MPLNVPSVDTILSTLGSPDTTVSGNVPAAGADILIAVVYVADGLQPASVTFGAQAFTPIGGFDKLWMYYLESPAQVTQPLTVTANAGSGSINMIAGVVGYSDYDTVTPFGDFVSDSNVEQPAISTTALTADASDLIVGAAIMIQLTINSDGAQTELINIPESVHQSGFLAISLAQKAGGENVTLGWTATGGSAGDNIAIGVVFNNASAGGPAIANVDGDNVITSTQENWPVNGAGFDNATVSITQGSVTRAQTVNSGQTPTEIICNTVFDSGIGPHLKYGTGTLEVENADSASDTQVITINPPAGLSYVNLGEPNATAANRITAVPDLAAGDQLEVSNVVGGTVEDVHINADATFDVADTVTSFRVRAWDASDQVWGPKGIQTLGGAPVDPGGVTGPGVYGLNGVVGVSVEGPRGVTG